MSDIAAIAAGLTKAGAIILRRMQPGHFHEAYYLRSSKDVWSPASTLSALARKGLVSSNYEMRFTRYTLTPLGLAVRAHLAQQESTHDQ